jgi:hypothetical protein
MRPGCGAVGRRANLAEKLRGAHWTSHGGLRSEQDKKGGEREGFHNFFEKKYSNKNSNSGLNSTNKIDAPTCMQQ